MRNVSLAAMGMALAACLQAESAVQTLPKSAAPPANVPIVSTDVASFSFRGLRVAVGETSLSHNVVIASFTSLNTRVAPTFT